MTHIDFLAISSVIIDDIVYPDGRTSMGVLGGGGVHTAYGMALSGETPGLLAIVGHDLPDDIRSRFEKDFDTSGLIESTYEQLRAWQIFEWNGKRSEIFRVDAIDPFLYKPHADSDDIVYTSATGISLLRDPQYVEAWRKRFPDATLLWEPARAYMMSGDYDGFLSGVPHADIISPNLLEAQTVYNIKDEVEIIRRLLADGVQVVALRMGEKGSLVAQQGSSSAYLIPPVDVDEIVDQTGAGNTYCGGFVVGWCRHHDLVMAGCYGAVAASFALETIGAAEIPEDLTTLHANRLKVARQAVEEIAL
jgi:sugar/nucleoside kinase (ribokinase family)